MRVAVVYNAVSNTPSPDERDVLVQVDAVTAALVAIGFEPVAIPCTLDLAHVQAQLAANAPDCVFNLVESLAGHDSLSHLAPALFDALGLPYTGASTEATFLSAHKLLAKERMIQAGIPTPEWIAASSVGVQPSGCSANDDVFRGEYIIKSVRDHASFGLDETSIVCDVGRDELQARLADCAAATGRQFFAERYIAGREFNLSLLDGPIGAEVLPPAEIDFSAFPPHKPRIVDYRAKWAEESFEYQQTPRRFTFAESDGSLLENLQSLALACWKLFGLSGYARVDFRVDAAGRPWVLEVNSNPCLSPDAGYAAALAEVSLDLTEAVGRIVAAALVRRPRSAGIGAVT